METDVLGGVQMGYRTVLVLSGGTKIEQIPNFAYQPDLVVDSIASLVGNLSQLDTLLPTVDRTDDTPHDIKDWVRRHAS